MILSPSINLHVIRNSDIGAPIERLSNGWESAE
jgi:hypothetical protein